MTDHTASPMSDPLTEEAQKPVMHDYPKRGARTSCCDRDRNDLPFADGMTTRAEDVTCDGTYMDRLVLALTERTVAWHVAALASGLSGQEALNWVHWHDLDETNEILYDLCKELGVELGRIKPYPLREREVASPPEQPPAVEAARREGERR